MAAVSQPSVGLSCHGSLTWGGGPGKGMGSVSMVIIEPPVSLTFLKNENKNAVSASRACWDIASILGLAQHGPVVVIQLLSHVFATPWTAACHVSLSFTISRSLMKPMSIESVMPSNHLNLCCPLLLLPSIFPSTGVFSNELTLHIRWPMY